MRVENRTFLILLALLGPLLLESCAADVGNYAPVMDPVLETPATPEHLKHCRRLVAAQPQQTLWGAVANQASTNSGQGWLSALELGTSGAVEAAVGATVVGALLGAKTGISARQATAEGRVDNCLRNYKEPLF
jgi:hypothetical protein